MQDPKKIELLTQFIKKNNKYIVYETSFDTRNSNNDIGSTIDLKAALICGAILGENLIPEERYKYLNKVFDDSSPTIKALREANNIGELNQALQLGDLDITQIDPGAIMFNLDKESELGSQSDKQSTHRPDEFVSRSNTEAVDNADRYTEEGFSGDIHGIPVEIKDGRLRMELDGQIVNERDIDKKEEMEIIAKHRDEIFKTKERTYDKDNQYDHPQEVEPDFELELGSSKPSYR